MRAVSAGSEPPTGLTDLLAQVLLGHDLFEPWTCGCHWKPDLSLAVSVYEQHAEHVAAALTAALAPWVAQRETDTLRPFEALLVSAEWKACGPTCEHPECEVVNEVARILHARADRIAPTTERTAP